MGSRFWVLVVAWEKLSAFKMLFVSLESSISQDEELLHVDGHRPPYGRAKMQWLNGGERVREKDLCRSPRASLYKLSEVSRGNKQLLKLLSLEFLKMLCSFLRMKEKSLLNIIKKYPYQILFCCIRLHKKANSIDET